MPQFTISVAPLVAEVVALDLFSLAQDSLADRLQPAIAQPSPSVMPPKKGRGRGGGKTKGRGKAKAKQVVVAQGTEAFDENGNPLADGPGGGVVAVIPKAKAKGKASALRKKILDEMGEKSIEEALAEAKLTLQGAEATTQETAALEEAQAKQVDDAAKEFDRAKAQVEEAMGAEFQAASKYRRLKDERNKSLTRVEEQRRKLLEEQKRLAMLEVMALNASKIKLLEERRKAATEAAEAAKRAMLEQKQKEKEALEATRRQLEDTRASLATAKGLAAGRRVKRASELGSAAESPAKKHIEETDTVPATGVKDGEDIQ